MITFQIIERPGARLYRTLLEAMRSGDLKTLIPQKRGRKVVHSNPQYPGWINWADRDGVIVGTMLSPNKPDEEWKLFSAFIGRLAHRYGDRIHSLTIQFPQSGGARPARRKSRKSGR